MSGGTSGLSHLVLGWCFPKRDGFVSNGYVSFGRIWKSTMNINQLEIIKN